MSIREPIRLPDKPRLSTDQILLIAYTLGTSAMAFLASLNLLDGQGITIWAKALLIAAIAGLVSYGVNRFALDRGALLASRGYFLAGMISVGSILIVGLGLFASTYAGLTISQVRELALQRYGNELAEYVRTINAQTLETGRIIPVIDASRNDLEAKKQCELSHGCLSAKGKAGEGPTTRALQSIIGRAETIKEQLSKGQAERTQLLSKLNRLLGKYQSTLGNGEQSFKERRNALIKITAELQQTVSALKEALPLALLQAYATELETGLTIANRPIATKNVSALLMNHAHNLQSVLGKIENKEIKAPAFPALAGVADTFAYIGHFFPIAVLTLSVELVLPFTLWIYAWLDRLWTNYTLEQRQRRSDKEECDAC